jgi:hypothetical protein
MAGAELAQASGSTAREPGGWLRYRGSISHFVACGTSSIVIVLGPASSGTVCCFVARPAGPPSCSIPDPIAEPPSGIASANTSQSGAGSQASKPWCHTGVSLGIDWLAISWRRQAAQSGPCFFPAALENQRSAADPSSMTPHLPTMRIDQHQSTLAARIILKPGDRDISSSWSTGLRAGLDAGGFR